MRYAVQVMVMKTLCVCVALINLNASKISDLHSAYFRLTTDAKKAKANFQMVYSQIGVRELRQAK